MKRTFCLTSLLVLATCMSHSQADVSEKIDLLFKNWNTKDTPGCALGILKDNKVLYVKNYGLANLRTGKPITGETKFAVGSLTKQFTAYCLAILIEQKKIALDDDIRIYLPEFHFTKDTIRIKHLVYHTSGLYDFSNLIKVCGYTYDDVLDRQMIARMIYSWHELNFKPGEKFDYCNTGYFLLAQIIERVSGERINQFARKNIFGPLGMKNTFYYCSPDPVDINIAVSYSQNVFGKYQGHKLSTVPSGAGNIITTIHDLLLWELNFYRGKLQNSQLSELVLKEGTLNNGKPTGYCFGIRVGKLKNFNTVYHFGDFNSYESVMLRIPEENLSVIILSNDQMSKTFFDNYSLANKIAEILLSEDAGQSVPDNIIKPFLSEEQVKSYVGTYKSNKGFTSISYDDGQLKISHSWGDWYYSIFPESDTVFYDIYDFDYKYRFRIDNNSKIAGLWTSHTGYMEKVEADPSLTIQDYYSGNYFCKELNTTYLVHRKDDKLYCKINNQPSQELLILGKDSFRYKQNILKLVHLSPDQSEGIMVNNQFIFRKIK